MEFRDYLEKFGITTSDVDEDIWQAIEHLHGDDKRYLTGAYLPFLQFLGGARVYCLYCSKWDLLQV